ncbi:hypothetical protein A2V82_10510 [candidate division KSB1 bacterium RBG_16_48_16]|nr:MAG: hypothetical protein A2V82_10510 [candidate division KSB1 bacterium RBG_16_48_16]
MGESNHIKLKDRVIAKFVKWIVTTLKKRKSKIVNRKSNWEGMTYGWLRRVVLAETDSDPFIC